jgi:hypothetical protein
LMVAKWYKYKEGDEADVPLEDIPSQKHIV